MTLRCLALLALLLLAPRADGGDEELLEELARGGGRSIVWSGERDGRRLERATDGSFSIGVRTATGVHVDGKVHADEAALLAVDPTLHALWQETVAPIHSALRTLRHADREDQVEAACAALVSLAVPPLEPTVQAMQGLPPARRLVSHLLHRAAADHAIMDEWVLRYERALAEVARAEGVWLRAALLAQAGTWRGLAAMGKAMLNVSRGRLLFVRTGEGTDRTLVAIDGAFVVEVNDPGAEPARLSFASEAALARERPDLHRLWVESFED